jgi:hypothetical protein
MSGPASSCSSRVIPSWGTRHQRQQQAAGGVGNDHHRLALGAVLGQGGVELLGDRVGVVGPGQLRAVDRQQHIGDPATLNRLLALLDTPNPAFPIITP